MRPDSGSTGANTPNTSTSASAQMKSGTASNRPLTASISGATRRSPQPASPSTATAPPSSTANDERGDGELERRRQPLASSAEHVAVQRDRGAEIAAQRDRATQTTNCAARLRVEPVMRAQRRDVGGRGAGRDHHRDRVAGHDPQQHEDDDRDADQRDGRHAETAQDR